MKGDRLKNTEDYLHGLHWLRVDASLSQAELAEASGVSQKQISRYESLRVRPYASTVKKLAKALNCSVKELYRPRQVA